MKSSAPRFLLLLACGFLSAIRLVGQQPETFILVRAPVVALTHAQVIDGLNHAPLENQILVIRDGKTETVCKDGVGYDSKKRFDAVKGLVGIQ